MSKNKKILDALSKTRNPYDIADALDIKVSEVRRVMYDIELPPLPGWGRVKLQPHIVARRRVGDWGWAVNERLTEARRQHDQGRVTMCQGRDGDWIIQYAIPTRKPIRRAPYFYGG